MAYYFMVEKKKGQYIPLDITKSKCFSRTSNLKGIGAKLQEIDLFTMMFYNEKELRDLLLKEGILSLELYDKPLSIRFKKNEKYNKVMYDFLYQKDIEYVMEPRKIIKRINDKLLNEDFRFVEKIANNYLKYHECSSTAADVRAYANDSIIYGRRSRYFDTELDEYGDNVLIRMLKLLIYDYYQYPNGKVEYRSTFAKKYRNLHSIIAFVNNYDKKYLNEVKDNNQFSLFDKNEISKKKVRKREEIPGQLSLY